MAEMLVKHFYRYSAPKKKKMSYFRNQSLIMSLMHKKRAFSITTESPCFKRVMGIEPTYTAWKAVILPLNYTRSKKNITMHSPRLSMRNLRSSTV